MRAPLARVGDLAEQIRGVTYAKGDASDEPRDGYVPILRAGNISDDGLSLSDLVFVPAARVSDRQFLKRNDVLVAASSGSLDVVGKAALVNAGVKAGFGAFCKVLRPSAEVHPAYFAHFFRTPAYRGRVSALAAGANINNLRNEDLDDLTIPLPSVEEQRRLAEILDRADALRAKWRAALAQVDGLTQAIFLEMFGDPATNPRRLPSESLGTLIKVRSGEFLPAASMAPNGTFAVLGGNGVNGYHDEFLFEEQQIVIGRVGVYCGCVHVSPQNSWITDNALYVSERSDRLEFVYLASALTFARLNQYASQSGQPLVSGARIYPVEILVPPLHLQRQFASRAVAVDKLKASHRASLAQIDALFASLQHRAFRGEL